jgi:multisubunit Na+/H+ antiporter MnhG subunit
MGHLIALGLTLAGVVVAVLASLGAAAAADTLPRAHFATLLTSVATPLVGLGLCVQLGVGLAAASVVLAVVVIAVGGPPLTSAVARVAAQRSGALPAEEPP